MNNPNSTSKPTYLTSSGAEKIKVELENLKGPQREMISKRLHDAIQMGDLSENADYHKAKEDQSFLEGRIQELDHTLLHAVIIHEADVPKNEVAIGTHVTVQVDDEETEEYYLVGAKEADSRAGKISDESPIGKALLGHVCGDTVFVDIPNGKIKIKVLKIG
jgi:transcription elongation factor GreA